MKITNSKLEQIIIEELSSYLSNIYKLCPAGTKCAPESRKTKWWRGSLNEEEKWSDALLPQWVKDLKNIELQRCIQKEMGHPAAQCPDKDLAAAAKAQIAVNRVTASPQSPSVPTETSPTAQLEQIINEELQAVLEELSAADFENMADTDLIRQAHIEGKEEFLIYDGEGDLDNREDIIQILKDIGDRLSEKKKYTKSFYTSKERRANHLISKGVDPDIAYGVADEQMAKAGKKKKKKENK